jgi:hypothetical protein
VGGEVLNAARVVSEQKERTMTDKVTIPALLQMQGSGPALLCREAQTPLFLIDFGAISAF